MAETGAAEAKVIRGTVAWFDAQKGYGFLKSPDLKKEVFVHFSAINAEGYKKLEDGQSVEFHVITTPKGPQAIDVTPM